MTHIFTCNLMCTGIILNNLCKQKVKQSIYFYIFIVVKVNTELSTFCNGTAQVHIFNNTTVTMIIPLLAVIKIFYTIF